ncbi:MAG TPA: hypothetical protein DGG94_15305 [Micromonosporaceae bacterium]|nr:hypothetical protein [Micromonosporaceae bacterium]
MGAKSLLMWVVLALVGLVLVGVLAVWLIKALFGLFFYLIVGALLIGGALYLVRWARRSIGAAPGRKRIRGGP